MIGAVTLWLALALVTFAMPARLRPCWAAWQRLYGRRE